MEELKNEKKTEETQAIEEKQEDLIENLQKELQQQKEKYLRLYAEFENYKKVSNKEKEEIVSHSNEKLIAELLPVIDNFELAIKHAGNENNPKWVESLKTGLDNTLKEFLRVLEKFGLRQIETVGKPFNPEVHHAVATVETSQMEENMVVEELRKGYIYRDKVLRASLVTVSKRPRLSSEGESSHPLGAQNDRVKEE